MKCIRNSFKTSHKAQLQCWTGFLILEIRIFLCLKIRSVLTLCLIDGSEAVSGVL